MKRPGIIRQQWRWLRTIFARVAFLAVMLQLQACAGAQTIPEKIELTVRLTDDAAIAAAADTTATRYKPDGLAWANTATATCTVWLKRSFELKRDKPPFDEWLAGHELAHCLGFVHDRDGRWYPL